MTAMPTGALTPGPRDRQPFRDVAVLSARERLARLLELGDRAARQLRSHRHGVDRCVGCHPVLADPAARREHDEVPAAVLGLGEQPHLLVVAEEGPRLGSITEQVLAEEAAVIVEAEPGDEGRGQVDLAGEHVDAARGEVAGCIEDGRDVIAVGRQAGAAGDRCTVVRDDHEQRVVEPRACTRLLDEPPDRPVGVLDRAVPAGLRGDVDAAVRVRVRTVVGGGHQVQEAALPGGGDRVDAADRVVEQILVRHAPDVGEADTIGRQVAAVLHLVAVVGEEPVHVVEVAVAAVEESRLEALVAQHRAQRGELLVAGTAQHRLARQRRQRGRQGFEAAHRARADCVHLREQHAFGGEAVDRGRQAAVVAERAEELGAEALDLDHDDVARARAGALGARRGLRRPRVGCGGPARALRHCGGHAHDALRCGWGRRRNRSRSRSRIRNRSRNRSRSRSRRRGMAHARPGLRELCERVVVHRGIEALEGQTVVAQRGDEAVRAAAGQLLVRDVRAQRGIRRQSLVVPQPDAGRGQHQCNGGGARERTRGQPPRRTAPCGPRADHAHRARDRQRAEDAQDRRHRIRLADVAHHFGGVDQVIDGDEVEAGRELVPEQGFGDGQERQREQQQRHDRTGEDRACPCGACAPVQQRAERGHQPGQHRPEGQVADEPARERVEQHRRREIGDGGCCQQHDARDGGDRRAHQQRQRGEVQRLVAQEGGEAADRAGHRHLRNRSMPLCGCACCGSVRLS
ncbi:MAG TPA: hypothetical protein PK072_13485 [Quisquiliibacterium sp.]|nr:hypothetical protein [Quisquiliibacterium sp.]